MYDVVVVGEMLLFANGAASIVTARRGVLRFVEKAKVLSVM